MNTRTIYRVLMALLVGFVLCRLAFWGASPAETAFSLAWVLLLWGLGELAERRRRHSGRVSSPRDS